MVAAYRIELASSGRAGCVNQECKSSGNKIAKGTLRLGVFVTIQDHQTWKWKHWGCVTPKQIENVKVSIEDDVDLFDGFEDMSESDQERIRKALEQGHVAHEDWNGDPEMNQPGQNGFRTPETKRKMKAEKEAQKEEAARAAGSANEDGRASEAQKEHVPDATSIKKETIPQNLHAPDHNSTSPSTTKPSKRSKAGTKRVKKEADDDDESASAATQTKRRKKGPSIKAEENSDLKNVSQIPASSPPSLDRQRPNLSRANGDKRVKQEKDTETTDSPKSGSKNTNRSKKSEAKIKREAEQVTMHGEEGVVSPSSSKNGRTQNSSRGTKPAEVSSRTKRLSRRAAPKAMKEESDVDDDENLDQKAEEDKETIQISKNPTDDPKEDKSTGQRKSKSKTKSKRPDSVQPRRKNSSRTTALK